MIDYSDEIPFNISLDVDINDFFNSTFFILMNLYISLYSRGK